MTIPGSLLELCLGVFGERVEIAETYAEILACEGIEWGVIGPREKDRIWERHIVNSLCLLPLIESGQRVTDIGSGAGLPGIPLAIARPDLRIVLVEPMQRRVDFLSMCLDRLGLADSVEVTRVRAEDYRGSPEVFTCRALTSMTGLVSMMGARLGTTPLLAIKGDRASIEIEEARSELKEQGLTAEILKPEVGGIVLGTVIRVRKKTLS